VEFGGHGPSVHAGRAKRLGAVGEEAGLRAHAGIVGQ
jgi:hypothetical protein